MLGEVWKSFTVALGANEIRSAVMAVYPTFKQHLRRLVFPEIGTNVDYKFSFIFQSVYNHRRRENKALTVSLAMCLYTGDCVLCC